MDETDALLTELATFFGLVTRATRGSDEDPVLTGTQRLAMMNIADAGPLRLHELGDRMGTTDPTASRAVDALVASGLVERVVDSRDRRALQIAVTREGRSRVACRAAPGARQEPDRALAEQAGARLARKGSGRLRGLHP